MLRRIALAEIFCYDANMVGGDTAWKAMSLVLGFNARAWLGGLVLLWFFWMMG